MSAMEFYHFVSAEMQLYFGYPSAKVLPDLFVDKLRMDIEAEVRDKEHQDPYKELYLLLDFKGAVWVEGNSKSPELLTSCTMWTRIQNCLMDCPRV
jgi:hypothetical protein